MGLNIATAFDVGEHVRLKSNPSIHFYIYRMEITKEEEEGPLFIFYYVNDDKFYMEQFLEKYETEI